MDENNSTDMLVKSRPVLEYVTNSALKVAPFRASGDSMSKFGDGFVKNVDNNIKGKLALADRSFLGTGNRASGKHLSVDSGKLSSLRKPQSTTGLPISCSSIDSSAVIDIPDDEPPGTAMDCSVSRVSLPTCSDPCDGDGNGIGQAVTVSNFVSQGSPAASTHGPVEFQKSVLEGCSLLKGGASTNSDVDFDFIKTCSCSFCLKAGHILANLHYQDVAGRITALKKSQKEVSNLVNRNPILEESKRLDGDEKSNRLVTLENDLIGQWRNLFLHMQDSLESDKLLEKYNALKELRDNCKRDLEMMNTGQRL